MAVTGTAAAKIWICGKGFGKTAATAVTTGWQRELGLVVSSATEILVARHQQKWRRELGLQYLVSVAAERQNHFEDNYDGGGANFGSQRPQGSG